MNSDPVFPLTRPIAHSRNLGIWLLVATVVVVLSSGVAAAVTHTSGTIHGCEARSGALSIRKDSSCPRSDKAISWNSKGPKGSTGPKGVPGAAGPSSTMFSEPAAAGFNSSDGSVTMATLPLKANANYLVNFTADASSQINATLDLKCTITVANGSTIDGIDAAADTYVDLPSTDDSSDIAITATAATGSTGTNLQLACEQTTDNTTSSETVAIGSIELTATEVGSLKMVTS